jgi:hypothetical protein
MMLVIRTQDFENYGTAEDPYWKHKGGSEFKVVNLPARLSDTDITMTVMRVRGEIEYSNPMSETQIVDWSVESDDYLSWFEKSQLELDGEIVYREPIIEYAD